MMMKRFHDTFLIHSPISPVIDFITPGSLQK